MIGGLTGAPHGQICAALLPHVFATNIKALHQREPDSPFITRYTTVSRLLAGDPTATTADGIEWLHKLIEDLEVPKLSSYGVGSADFPTIIDRAKLSSSMKGNCIELTDEELNAILADAT